MKYLIACAALAALAVPCSVGAAQPAEIDQTEVAYDLLALGRTAEAVDLLTDGALADADDPAILINLGTAYARQGRTAEAAIMFKAAMTSPTRYQLELADGRWIDSRAAAKMALEGLRKDAAIAVR